jgi:hypothetical protein
MHNHLINNDLFYETNLLLPSKEAIYASIADSE